MDALTLKVNLDCLRKDSQAIINAKVGEANGRKVVFTLYEGRTAFFVPAGASVIFRAQKPDGTILYNNCVIDDGKVEYTITSQTVAVAGVYACELQIVSDGRIIYSPYVTLNVMDNLYADTEVESSNEFTELENALNKIPSLEVIYSKYTKPEGGIPKSDLAQDVQASLGKADTALQSVPSTYRTASAQDTIDSGKVDKVTGKGLSTNDYTNAAKAKVDALAPVATSGNYNDLTNKPTIPAPVTEQTVSGWGFTKNTGTYSKPTGGIPKTDLTSTVQTSLNKADTALQTHQSLADYRTALAQDIIDSDLSDRIEAIEGKEASWDSKQDKLIAGNNITIAADGKTISATGGGGGSSVELDATLTQSGKAADAKAVGDALAGKQGTISDLATIRSGAVKGATALQAVPSTYRTAFAQDIIDSDLDDRISVIEGAGYLTLATLPKYEGVVE